MKTTFLYFVKYPTPGKVKTRLAKSIGDDKAAEIYNALAKDTLGKLSTGLNEDVSITIYFDPPNQEQEIKDWLPGNFNYLAQEGSDLGKRLQFGFSQSFQAGADHVIALGSDVLGFEASLRDKAVEELKNSDVVIGPCQDGGYYLIGLSQDCPTFFENIPWSTEKVLDLTLQVAQQKNLNPILINELEDLDEIEGLEKNKKLIESIL